MPSPDVAEIVARFVRAYDVDTVFGLLGEANLALMLALEREGVTWVAMRREDGVVAAADGYAQATERLAVAVVSQGPALANALNPLIGAAKGGTPLVLLTGGIAPDRRNEPQWIDQRELVEGTGHVRYRRVDDAASAADTIAEAFSLAQTERAPVVLEIPTETQVQPVTADTRALFAAASVHARDRMTSAGGPRADPDASAAAIAALAAAERPLLLAGRGARGARAELLALARRVGALVGTTLPMKGYFDGDPTSLGVIGGFSTERARDLAAASDVIVVFGASLNQFTTSSGRLLRGKTLIRVDTRQQKPDLRGAGAARILELTGDSAVTARALTDGLRGDRTAWHARPAAPDVIDDQSDPSGLDLRVVSQWLDRVLPADRALALDLGYFTSEPSVHIGVRAPDRHAFTLHFGSIGLGLATAIGVSSAHRDLPTVCAIGDGGLMSSLQELETVARSGLPVVVAVYDDDAYGVEVYELQHRGEDEQLAVFPRVAFAPIAQAMGLSALTIEDDTGLEAAQRHLESHPGRPVLLDFRLRRGVMTRWYLDSVHADFLARTGTHHHDDTERPQ
ncbi:thiamine pyrophosphate-binding protein [Agromyces aerolatus]|uniref:thiamine pyrophosphate-binding protein n=1 Tax=Agromyces sp. LY-1074 TaxID=3074080 RepID=UPI002855A71B|nr:MULTISPECIES: thiamine pyrophosphate-binding protein [unclassified Agromyces]MDR5700855.1 thiamine pyrophosphate-binding protein [Agromyces sp. LY-1074]MDR5707484.1 thiamine pyrophosphate-binding protein [Agromyces sp. LY-1358]